MPVRPDSTAPAAAPAAPATPPPAAAAPVAAPTASNGPVLYTEATLMPVKTGSLLQALQEMGVDPSKQGGSNTHKKLRLLFLENQQQYLAQFSRLPAFELESKNEFPGMEGATSAPAAAAPAQPGEAILAVTSASTVTFTAGATVNVGRFESRRVEASITIPTEYTAEDLAKAKNALEAAKGVVFEKLNHEVAAIEAGRPTNWDQK